MEMDPHQLIEGMVIAGRAIQSHRGFIYIRGEYRYVLDIVDGAIAEAYAHGYLGKTFWNSANVFNLLPNTGAAPYESAKERARREWLEGNAGNPGISPRFPAGVGL